MALFWVGAAIGAFVAFILFGLCSSSSRSSLEEDLWEARKEAAKWKGLAETYLAELNAEEGGQP